MDKMIMDLIEKNKVIKDMSEGREIIWMNPDLEEADAAFDNIDMTMDDIKEAEARLVRFAPFIMKAFPETEKSKGIIESPLVEISKMKDILNEEYGAGLTGRLYLKEDSHLPIAGSIKARGGVYEILKHTEKLAIDLGILKKEDDYSKLCDPELKKVFSEYTIQVGSTGNLGLSIGIISAVIGYKVIVHMSADARQWKKDLLRSYGVNVIEYESDYSVAVAEGRRQSDLDPKSYFVDDENSKDLFMGYAVAALRLERQFREQGIIVDEEHPLFVYIPCGVGGAPGGATFGLKKVFGDYVHVFFSEPVNSPCMTLGMASGLNSRISVQDIGLSGLTHADGLAVGRPSGFVGSVMKTLLSGIFTLDDYRLYDYMRDLINSENIFIEPSACASFIGPARISVSEVGAEYIRKMNLSDKMKDSIHIAWATGGNLVPETIRQEYIGTYLDK